MKDARRAQRKREKAEGRVADPSAVEPQSGDTPPQ